MFSRKSILTGPARVEPAAKPRSTTDVFRETNGAGDSSGDPSPHDLKRKTAHGALVSTIGQAANFVLRTGSMIVLARLLTPADFGLVGMATACTGFLSLFRDAGLSVATVQRESITRAQTSTLFWLNLGVGVLLAALCAVMAPLLTVFYHEPRLFWVTVLTGASFIFFGAAAQHRALLERQMRFTILSIIDIVSLFVSVPLGIGMAFAGLEYWALVYMGLCQYAVSSLGVWVVSGWIPGRPQRGVGVRSMVKYGSTLTLHNFILYLAGNADKVLIGRFCGAEALGIYGRAYQLINLPTDNLNSSIGLVSFPALSRVQDNPERLRSYFLKGYAFFLSIVIPITMACGLFAEDIVRVFLGAKWGEAVPLFRILAPSVLAFSLVKPFFWLLVATGRATRMLWIGVLIGPVVVLGHVIGLRYGPAGVAAGLSITSALLVVPTIIWSTRGTSISVVDTLKEIMRPSVSILLGAGATLVAWRYINLLTPGLIRLTAATTVLFGVYTLVLWFGMGQKAVYLGLLRGTFGNRGKKEASVKPEDM
jgi:O-antigen/teichoic acid export membrane protein